MHIYTSRGSRAESGSGLHSLRLHPQLLRTLAWNVVMAAVYFGAGKFGLSFAMINPSASAVWLPTGIALSACLLLGYRVWPGILAGAFLVNLTTAGTVATSLVIGAGNTLEGLAGAYLLNHFAGGRAAFDSPAGVFRFALLAGLVSTAISASVGVTALAIGGFVSWDTYGATWLTWWLGDAIGDLVVAPALVLWNVRADWSPRLARMAEALALLVSLVLVGVLVFGKVFPISARNYPLEFLCLPVILWVAFRFSRREAALATLIFSAIAIAGTLDGRGPFVQPSQNESLLLLQAFSGTVSLMGVAAGAAVFERQQVEERLRHSEHRFRLIVESSPNAIALTDAEGRIVQVNNRAEQFFGYTRGELIGQPVDRLVPDAVREAHHGLHMAYLQQPITRFIGKGRDLYARHKDGTDLPVEIGLSPLQTPDGLLVLSVIVDISQRKQAEEQLRRHTAELEQAHAQLQALGQTKDEFIANVSHELRTPITSIKLYHQILKQRLPREHADRMAILERETRRLEYLVESLLLLSRLERQEIPLELADQSLNGVAQELVEDRRALAAERRVALTFEARADLPTVRADGRLIGQVMSILLTNALNYTPPDGAVRVSTACEERDGQRWAGFAVRDTGPGIAPDEQDKLFGRFFRGRAGQESWKPGTGLGLAIAREIVERHGGRIEVESAGVAGQGATFRVWLPAAVSD